MTYSETLDYLFAKLPMFTRVGAIAYKKDITNIAILCNALGNPQNKFRSIHLAGTNGKGSCSHMLAAILQTAGYKTALHTSPHLKDFRERIKVNGMMCDEAFVVECTQKLIPLIEEIEPSFFEISVAMAFEYFAQHQVDIAVIETGLGGRLDSTNIINPILSIITNIGWDHMHLLGDTLEKIAFEKAGIIKQHTPVVIGEFLPETKPVFIQKAAEMHAPIVFAQEMDAIHDWHIEQHLLHVTLTDKRDNHSSYTIDLPGIYQTKNVLTVTEAIHQLQGMGWNINQSHIQQGLRHVKKITGLHGRWEMIHEHPTIVLDVGHNEDGIKQILQQLEISSYHHLHMVIGMVKDKEVDKVLSMLPVTATYYFTNAQIPRALPAHELQQKALSYLLQGKEYNHVNDALKDARAHAHPNDLILVCGSVFVVAEVDF